MDYTLQFQIKNHVLYTFQYTIRSHATIFNQFLTVTMTSVVHYTAKLNIRFNKIHELRNVCHILIPSTLTSYKHFIQIVSLSVEKFYCLSKSW